MLNNIVGNIILSSTFFPQPVSGENGQPEKISSVPPLEKEIRRMYLTGKSGPTSEKRIRKIPRESGKTQEERSISMGTKVEELAREKQEKAWRVIRSCGILPAWESIGADVHLVGSLKTGLLIDELAFLC